LAGIVGVITLGGVIMNRNKWDERFLLRWQ
jgi:hypothetical protein